MDENKDKVIVGVPSGRVMTIREYFEANPQSIHIINNNPQRKAVMLNGCMIEIGSQLWNSICDTKVLYNSLLGEVSILYHIHERSK